MIGALAKKIFGSANDRRLKTYAPKVKAINALEPQVEALSDEELKDRTRQFREEVAAGKTLDDLLVPAFATVREAAKRTLGQRHFDVQLIGGMVLHEGAIAEMRTGEGKTLVATLAVYLNALAGKGVHVVTVNDYLAKRDAEWMGQIYKFLGMTVGVVVHDLMDEERGAAYACDITYGTNNEYGFDYLRDNMKYEFAQMVQRGHNFAIVDEVDSILVDEARTPLIISGAIDDKSDLYNTIDRLIPKLNADDLELDEKQRTVHLTDAGNEHMEELLTEVGALTEGALYEAHNVTLVHHVNQALRAHKLFQKDKDYIVPKGEVVIIDEFTGRMMPGRRYSEGLHQALEAKERVQVQPENVTLASITFQNYFRLYDKLAGMTGTAATEANEFAEIYKLDVVEIPTNRPVCRLDEDDEVYRTSKEKLNAIAAEIKDASERMQPLLVGTTSIEKSEQLAEFLAEQGYKQIDFSDRDKALAKLYEAAKSGTPSRQFAVLNARFHEQEAHIVAEAGVPGAITIATNMAGRGTDIQLGGNLEMRIDEALIVLNKEMDAERTVAIAAINRKWDTERLAATAEIEEGLKTERQEDIAKLEQELEAKRDRGLIDIDRQLQPKRNKNLADLDKRLDEERNKKLADLDKHLDEERNKKLAELDNRLDEERNRKLVELDKQLDEESNRKLDEFDNQLDEELSRTLAELEKKHDAERVAAEDGLIKKQGDECKARLDELEGKHHAERRATRDKLEKKHDDACKARLDELEEKHHAEHIALDDELEKMRELGLRTDEEKLEVQRKTAEDELRGRLKALATAESELEKLQADFKAAKHALKEKAGLSSKLRDELSRKLTAEFKEEKKKLEVRRKAAKDELHNNDRTAKRALEKLVADCKEAERAFKKKFDTLRKALEKKHRTERKRELDELAKTHRREREAVGSELEMTQHAARKAAVAEMDRKHRTERKTKLDELGKRHSAESRRATDAVTKNQRAARKEAVTELDRRQRDDRGAATAKTDKGLGDERRAAIAEIDKRLGDERRAAFAEIDKRLGDERRAAFTEIDKRLGDERRAAIAEIDKRLDDEGKTAAAEIENRLKAKRKEEAADLDEKLEAKRKKEAAEIEEKLKAEREAAEARIVETITAEVADFKEKAKAAGGLYIIGTERHESRRIDNQLRGRSGRQGDPGQSKFFLSLQDDLMRIFGSERMDSMLVKLGLQEGEAIVHTWINKAIEKAQHKVEARNFDIRKNILKFDNVMNDQRKVIFERRREIMNEESVEEQVADMRADVVDAMVSQHIPHDAYAEAWDVAGLAEEAKSKLNLDKPVAAWAKEEGIADEEIKERLLEAADAAYGERVEKNTEPLMRMIEKQVVLQSLDTLWREHLVALDHLRQVIGWRGMAQRDPLNEYKSEALELFKSLMTRWDEAVTTQLMRVEVSFEAPPSAPPELPPMEMSHPNPEALIGGGQQLALDELNTRLATADFSARGLADGEAAPERRRDPGKPATWGKVGRNEPCPCGSGKKYKHCHGALV